MRIYEDLRSVQTRLTVLQYVTVVLFGLLVVIFWHLQVVRGREFREMAENNGRRDVTIAAPRGVLLDRNGRVLVENRPSFNVIVSPEHSDDLDHTISLLGSLLSMGEGVIRERMHRRGPVFRQVVVKADAGIEDVAAIKARRLEMRETSVEVVPLRSYPLRSAAAHVLGRVGEITEAQLQSDDYKELSSGDLIGQAGVEARYNRSLMGTDGVRQVIVNSRGVEVGEAKRDLPVAGPNLTLSLDAGLQTTMEQAFKGKNGAAVALDPKTGEILAMTSIPAYDPNEFMTGIDAALWNKLRNDPDNPLLNRVIQGQYAPGSVFKIVTAIAALEEGIITPETRFTCPGFFSRYDTIFRCHEEGGHGSVDLKKALAKSCNVYFWNIGVRLEIDRIARYAELLGLGSPTGIDLPHEASGLMPSPAWKQRVLKTQWYAGETVSVAIGQGQVTVTALQLARLAAAAATGTLVTPHLAKAVADQPVAATPPKPLGFRPETLEAVRRGLRAVVELGGTGQRASLPGITVCGKTGSAQVVASSRLAKDSSEKNQPHGWFAAFAPMDDPRIALAVMVEHGTGGGISAAPIAREILAHFFGVQVPAAAPATAPTPRPEPPAEDPMVVAGHTD
jgi:penicillin-binding protein 2